MRLTVQEAASLLDAPEDRVYDWIEDDKLPAQRVRGQYRINRTELLEWATEHGLSVSPRVFVQEQGPATPPVAAALRAGGIRYAVEGDVRDAVSTIIGSLPLASTDREALLHFTVVRGDAGLTEVAAGIAGPQVRRPAVLASGDSVMSLAFLAEPAVLTGAAHPIEAIFFVVSPTVHAHLTMVAKLTACLRHPRLKEALATRAPEVEIIAAAAEAEERL